MEPEIEFITSAEQAENNAAKRMREMGFSDAGVTAGGPDGGIDVQAWNAVAQVKWKSAQTGRPELQNLYGARGVDHSKQMLFFTASGYTREAVEYADSTGMALFAYDPTGAVRAASRAAEALLAPASPWAAAAGPASYDPDPFVSGPTRSAGFSPTRARDRSPRLGKTVTVTIVRLAILLGLGFVMTVTSTDFWFIGVAALILMIGCLVWWGIQKFRSPSR
ncbi:restriction endonuclease [Rhodococcus zopfii]|uniref:restriction endonuclease n=1 Tax=Rhodococcus zopfii TaxID=43772 RepID=UPI000934DCFE|nr:restriction endonuclease [Rhodococcus zopfii]